MASTLLSRPDCDVLALAKSASNVIVAKAYACRWKIARRYLRATSAIATCVALVATSPLDLMFFLSFAVTSIVVDVKILAGRRERGMAQIVAD